MACTYTILQGLNKLLLLLLLFVIVVRQRAFHPYSLSCTVQYKTKMEKGENKPEVFSIYEPMERVI